VDEWVDDYDDLDDQGRLWTAERDWPSDLDEQDDVADAIVPPTESSSGIPHTSDLSPPPYETAVTEPIPPEITTKELVPQPANETVAIVSEQEVRQEESAGMVILVMTTGTFLAVFAVYSLYSRKGGKKPSQVRQSSL